VRNWEPYVGAARASFDALLAECQELAIAKGERLSHDRLSGPTGGAAPDGRARRSARLPAGDARQDARRAHAGPGPSARRLASADLTLAESLPGAPRARSTIASSTRRIQNADRRKNEFLATLSHELRNPLAPLRSALHMLRGETLVRERQEQLLESMDRQVAQMTRLVEDLLDVSRITRGAIELRRETLDVSREIRNALESCRVPIETGGHKLSLRLPEEPLHVVADRVRLQQILENLILNAVKYTEPGGSIEVSAETELGGASFACATAALASRATSCRTCGISSCRWTSRRNVRARDWASASRWCGTW
jgi:signal transduction histidine kinase